MKINKVRTFKLFRNVSKQIETKLWKRWKYQALFLVVAFETDWKRLKHEENRLSPNVSVVSKRNLIATSPRHCDITYNVNFQYGGRQHIGRLVINGDSCIKINYWRSNGMQKEESHHGCLVRIEKSVPRDHCLASLAKASWCQIVTLWHIFLSTPHTHERPL